MKAFEYASPGTAELAQEALAGSPSACALSGGTDLLNRMKDYVTSPDRVVYLKGVASLAGIQGGTIGAGTTLAKLLADPELKATFPALWQAALEVGSVQIRNMATLGGNLLQRPRCWYYRAGHGLLAVKDGKSLVRAGDNRYHAIFQNDGDALFVAPSSLAVPLIALDAKAVILGAGGKSRTIPVADLYRIPKSDAEGELTLAPGEVLTSVVIDPAAAKAGKNATYEARQKQSHDWPIVLASVCVKLDGDKVASARIVLGGVAPVPHRSEAAEQAIVGKAINAETAAAAGAAAIAGAKPLSMNAYKVAVAQTVVKRALLTVIGDRSWEA